MRALAAIYRKEMRAYFFSPIAYVLWASFTALTGYFFYSGLLYYSMASMQAMQQPWGMSLNLQEMLVAPLMSNWSVMLMLISPLLTMRLISEEKRTGTIELLLSYPLTDFGVVLGKFLAALTMFALILLPTLIQVVILFWLGEPHLPAIMSGYLGLVCMGGAFIALGLTASALTENQIVSGVLAFVGLLMLWVVGWSGNLVGGQAGAVLKALSLGGHFEGFPKGLVNTADLAYFALFIGFFLFVTTRILEAKRWKA
ncbi:MAG: ABC transporter permease [Thermodesulfobacteriota bacterium]